MIEGFVGGQWVPPVQTIKYDNTPVHMIVYAMWLAVSIGFLFRRRHPRTVLGLLLVLLFAGSCLRSPATAAIYLPFVLYSVVVKSEVRPGRISTAGATIAALAVLSNVIGLAIGGGSFRIEASLDGTAAILLGWLAGEFVRNSRGFSALRVEFAAEKAAAAEAGRAAEVDHAVTEERAKLARELHDVVAHGMSVVALRAGVARMVIDSHPDQTREALAIIETTSRNTLQEMRLLVGVLRGDNPAEAEREPAPGLEDLPRLIATAELTGLDIDLVVRGQTRPLAPALDLSAYRIVQEALTNAARHAGPTTTHITIGYQPHTIEIDVRDEGPRPGATPATDLRQHGTGHGLIGIRERTALFGGTCTAGPIGSGYQVRAVLTTTDLTEAPITSTAKLISDSVSAATRPAGSTP